MDNKDSLLEGLYTDSGGFDRERVAQVLKLLLTIQREEHTVFFKKEANLKEEDKVLAYALLKKLLKNEGAAETGTVSGKEVKDQTGVKAGTVDAAMKKLKEDCLLVGSGSNYEIPTHQVEKIVDRLAKCGQPKK